MWHRASWDLQSPSKLPRSWAASLSPAFLNWVVYFWRAQSACESSGAWVIRSLRSLCSPSRIAGRDIVGPRYGVGFLPHCFLLPVRFVVLYLVLVLLGVFFAFGETSVLHG